MPKIDTIDITLINFNSEIYPRAKVDEELVETYRLNMEAGIKFPPLVVQKDTHILVDGFHRYHALKKLKREKVKVEILDIPDTELRAEAIRRNIKQGKRLTNEETVRNIINLRFGDRKKEKEIAEIVDLSEGRISQICQEFRIAPRDFPELSNFNSKDTKIDWRVKADEKKKEKILKDLKTEVSGKKIAKKYGISQARVSQIKKEHEEWVSSLVYIKAEPIRASSMFNAAFINGLLKKARLEFKEKGVLIRNFDGENLPLVVAVYPAHYFKEYRVNNPIDGYVESDILGQLKKVEANSVELALVNEQTWKIRYEDHEKSNVYENLDWREFPLPLPNIELDEEGIPKTVHAKVEVFQHHFPRKKKGLLTLRMKGEELTGSYKCDEWKCDQTFKLERIAKKGDATAYVDLTMLDEILKTFKGPVWIGMWSDQPNIAIGQGSVECKVCFIIGQIK